MEVVPTAATLSGPAHPTVGPWRWQVQAPSWLTSLVLHALLVLLLGYSAGLPRHGTNAPPGAELVATFSTDDVDGEFFEDEPVAQATLSADSSGSASPGPSGMSSSAVAEVFGEAPPVDARAALPSALELAGVGAGDRGQATGAGGFTSGGGSPVRVEGGKARTKIYGVVGEGNTFVYVFDRSGSMGGSGNTPLTSAKRELIASLANLGDLHRFQIIFYNERTTAMRLGRQPGGMIFGNEQNKKLAQSFIKSITADGGTRHEEALEKALRLAPDVIFFLTDADQPELSPAQLEKIRKTNGGRTSIHTIEFGLGPNVRRDNFLAQLARQNGGEYVYIDITRRGALE